MKNGTFIITYLAQIKKLKNLNFGKFWTSEVQFLDLDMVGRFWM